MVQPQNDLALHDEIIASVAKWISSFTDRANSYLRCLSIATVLAALLAVSAAANVVYAQTLSVKQAQKQGAKQINAVGVLPQTGWWWNPLEPGSGYGIERQGNALFMAAFMYDSNGRSVWYTSVMTLQANGTYTGSLSRYGGGQSLLGAYQAPANPVAVGAVSADFTSATSGSLTMTGTISGSSVSRVTPIERFSFVANRPASNATFESGWWWSDVESGRGYFVEVQGNQAFIAAFMYDTTGQPVWYGASAVLGANQSMNALLLSYKNGQQLLQNYVPNQQVSGDSGTMVFNLNAGQMALPNGRAVALKRFIFNSTPSGTSAATYNLTYSSPSLAAYAMASSSTCYSPAAANRITLSVPAVPANTKVPLLIVLNGGGNGAPIDQAIGEVNNLAAIGTYAVATFSFSTCGFSSPLVYSDPNDGTSDGEFARAMAVITSHINTNAVPVNLSNVALMGSSWGGNYVRTLAVKYANTYNIRGAMAVAGGCNFGCPINGYAYGEPNSYPLVSGKQQVIAAISTQNDELYLSLARVPRDAGNNPVCSPSDYSYGLGADSAKVCFRRTIPAASLPTLIAYIDTAGGGHGAFSNGTEAVKRQYIRYMFGLDVIPDSLKN